MLFGPRRFLPRFFPCSQDEDDDDDDDEDDDCGGAKGEASPVTFVDGPLLPFLVDCSSNALRRLFLSTPGRRIGEQTARTRLPRAKDFLRDAS